MVHTAQLTSHHDVARSLLRDIRTASMTISDRQAALAITFKLARLAGMLRIHFALEDDLLYQQLTASPDPIVARRAVLIWARVGGLTDRFEAFFATWSSADRLFAEQHRFRDEASRLFAEMTDRMDCEEQEVFAMISVWPPKRAAA